jgi:hypothetical protein
MKIEKLRVHHLRNDAHFQFHTEFHDLVVKHCPQKMKIKPQFDAYKSLYEREDEALKKISKSALTDKIHEADKARDEIYLGMADVNKGMCRHFNKDTADAAVRIKIVLDTYGNIAKKPLNEQTSAVYNIVQDLRGDKYASYVTASGLSEWVDELDSRNIALEALMKERFGETAAKSDIVMTYARKELDEAYRQICEIINVYAMLEDAREYEEFIRTLNAVIAKYAVTLAHQHHHKRNEEPRETEDVAG